MSAGGVEVYPLSRFWMTPPRGGRQGLVLSYAGFDERAIRRGVGRLAKALELGNGQ